MTSATWQSSGTPSPPASPRRTRETPRSIAEPPRRALAVRCLGLAAAALLLAACDGARGRPLPTEDAGPAALDVELLSPRGNELIVAGNLVAVRVRAAEPNGRLRGVGYVARWLTRGTVDSAMIDISTADSALETFPFRAPDSLPSNAQIDFYGIAFGPQGQHRLTEPTSVIVIQCPEGAYWCQ